MDAGSFVEALHFTCVNEHNQPCTDRCRE